MHCGFTLELFVEKMKNNITFKEYLKSKEQLTEAFRQTPISLHKYVITKYCSLRLGESKEEQIIVDLRPQQLLLIEWEYNNNHEQKFISSISIKGNKQVSEDAVFTTYLPPEKIKKWLDRNTA